MKRRVFLGTAAATAASASLAFAWNMPGSSRLKLWTNGVDYVIASDISEARRIVAEVYGYEQPLGQSELEEIDWEGWMLHPPNEDFTILDNKVQRTKTVQEWIDESGAGYFACSDY